MNENTTVSREHVSKSIRSETTDLMHEEGIETSNVDLPTLIELSLEIELSESPDVAWKATGDFTYQYIDGNEASETVFLCGSRFTVGRYSGRPLALTVTVGFDEFKALEDNDKRISYAKKLLLTEAASKLREASSSKIRSTHPEKALLTPRNAKIVAAVTERLHVTEDPASFNDEGKKS